MARAAAKGSRDSVVFVDGTAFVVNRFNDGVFRTGDYPTELTDNQRLVSIKLP